MDLQSVQQRPRMNFSSSLFGHKGKTLSNWIGFVRYFIFDSLCVVLTFRIWQIHAEVIQFIKNSARCDAVLRGSRDSQHGCSRRRQTHSMSFVVNFVNSNARVRQVFVMLVRDNDVELIIMCVKQCVWQLNFLVIMLMNIRDHRCRAPKLAVVFAACRNVKCHLTIFCAVFHCCLSTV